MILSLALNRDKEDKEWYGPTPGVNHDKEDKEMVWPYPWR